jgi:hypothetical protein
MGTAFTATLSIFASLGTVASLGWQFYTWWHKERTKVKVRFFSRPYYDGCGREAGWGFIVDVANGSDHDIYVTDVTAEEGDGYYLPINVGPLNGRSLRDPVPPHGHIELGCDETELEALSPTKVRVRLADGSLHLGARDKPA